MDPTTITAVITAVLGGAGGLVMAFAALRRVLGANSQPRTLLQRVVDWLDYDHDQDGVTLWQQAPAGLRAAIEKELGRDHADADAET